MARLANCLLAPKSAGEIHLPITVVETTGPVDETRLSLARTPSAESRPAECRVGVFSGARRGMNQSQMTMPESDSTHESHLLVPGPGKEGYINMYYHVATTGSIHESHLLLPDRGEGESHVEVYARARRVNQS